MKKVTNFIKTTLLEIKLKSFKHQQELVLVTGSSSSHFKSLYQFLESIHIFEPNTKTVVYDLGLKDIERDTLLSDFKNIDLRKFDFEKYPDHVNINVNDGEYAWKPIIIDTVLNEFKCSICWLDAGNVLFEKLETLRKVIEFFGFYSPYSKGIIKDWTHENSLKYLQVDKHTELLKQTNLNGACIAADYNNLTIRKIIAEWKDCALDKNCIAPKGATKKNHRYDQAILSTLIYKHVSKLGKKMTYKKFGFKIHQDIDD